MGWFKKKQQTHGVYKVTITYEAIVIANNDVHAVNRVREVRNDIYAMTRKYIGQFSINEASAKAKKL